MNEPTPEQIATKLDNVAECLNGRGMWVPSEIARICREAAMALRRPSLEAAPTAETPRYAFRDVKAFIQSWTPCTPESYAQRTPEERDHYQLWVVLKQRIERAVREDELNLRRPSPEAALQAKRPDILAFQIAIDGDNDNRAAWLLDHEEEIRAWLSERRPSPEAARLREALLTLQRYRRDADAEVPSDWVLCSRCSQIVGWPVDTTEAPVCEDCVIANALAAPDAPPTPQQEAEWARADWLTKHVDLGHGIKQQDGRAVCSCGETYPAGAPPTQETEAERLFVTLSHLRGTGRPEEAYDILLDAFRAARAATDAAEREVVELRGQVVIGEENERQLRADLAATRTALALAQATQDATDWKVHAEQVSRERDEAKAALALLRTQKKGTPT